MSTETTQNNNVSTHPPAVESKPAAAPKPIVNAQTVCNELNEKKKLCNGHLKQLGTGGEGALKHLRGDDAVFKCQVCGTLYMGPPLGHLRDPDKQSRFVERELTALLLAAGGTMPIIVKNEKGAYVLAEEAAPHTAPPSAKPSPPTQDVIANKAAEAEKPAPAKAAQPTGEAAPAPAKEHAIEVGPIAGADGPVPGETREQKIARLTAVSAEAKRRRELREAAEASGEVAANAEPPVSQSAAPTAPPKSEPAEKTEDAASLVAASETTAPAMKSAPIAGADGPVPGESFEQKIERLKRVVAGARERAIREGKREA
jgi:hypothetical protein